MKRIRVVLAAAAAVTCVLTASAAIAAYDAFRTAINFSKSVQLADGSILKPGHYDVQINFTGVGNVAEFVFLQGGMVKGRHRGEARGFAKATGGGGSGSPTQLKFEDTQNKKLAYDTQQDKTTPLNPEYKEKDVDKTSAAGAAAPNALKIENEKKYIKGEAGAAGATRAFSWGAAGFGPNTPLKQTEGGGTLTLHLDSSNSPAGIIAILKVVPAGAKSPLKQ